MLESIMVGVCTMVVILGVGTFLSIITDPWMCKEISDNIKKHFKKNQN